MKTLKTSAAGLALLCFSIISTTALAADKLYKVQLETSMGNIVLELNATRAPMTVQNFLAYVKNGFYNGTIFHRVIDGFMVQGGGFTEDMQQKPTHNPIRNEANNGLKNERGTVAMARTNQPHSATAQFFINVVNNEFLNYRSESIRGWGYTVFGRVASGMDVVDRIRKTPTGMQGPFRDVPNTPVVILNATILADEPAAKP
ncbi:MAG: peptidylprolyl isomerase [Gammaproteobacteria bacterium]|nr:peptidylprolyl isomerase [Gammaproteobacteria bacterium]MDH5799179.1 peptidylprolyl isomerase [Gammaproteobacteria bacterium]